MKKICGIYKFTNKLNRKVYIGQSKDIKGRYKSYTKPSMIKKGQSMLIMRAIKKYGLNNFDFDILIECPEENLNYWEKFYVKYYCSDNVEYGYNMTSGGDSFCRGREPWNKGKEGVYSEDTRKSMGAKNIGNTYRRGSVLSQETKDLISEHGKGRKESEETRKKKSIARSGAGNPMYGKPSPNTNKHRVWNDETHTKYHYE